MIETGPLLRYACVGGGIVDLIRRLEDHWVACMASPGTGARVTRLAGAVVVRNPDYPGPLTNFISVRGAQAGGLAPLLDVGSALLLEANAMPLLFLAADPLLRERAERELVRLGWVPGGRQHVLFRPLDGEIGRSGSEVDVEPVSADQIAGWARLMTRAYGVSGSRARRIRAVWTALAGSPGEGASAVPVWGRVEGRPAGTGFLWVQGMIAGLYGGAVLQRHRRRGVETATLQFRLETAAALGATLAYLQTEVGSAVERICLNRLGFQIAYERSFWFPLGQEENVQNVWI